MHFLSLILALMIVCLGFLVNEQTPSVTTITFDRAQTRQTIEGFGASGAWWAQAIGGWSDENRQRIVDLLFDPQRGIGLTLLRYNVGGGEHGLIDPWRNTETFEIGPGQYDWTRDANALWVLRAAHAAGVTDIVMFANSPPGRMTVSGRAAGHMDGNSNLRPDMREEFARYLVDIARYLIEEEHLPVRWISPINEPQWDWRPAKGQEGCHYTTDEIVSVLHALRAEIERSGLDVGISAIDAGEWGTAAVYARRLFDDPALRDALDHFAVHSYWSDRNDKRNFVRFMDREYPGIRLWMSEWTEMQGGRDLGMDSALLLANTVHDDLTIGGVTSWQYWIAVSKYNFRDGLIYTREYTERIEETKRLWALGNFSRFVRPGATRIGAAADQESVQVSAYTAPDSGALIAVLINNSAVPQPIAFAGLGAEDRFATAYETSDAASLSRVWSGAVSDSEGLSLAPRSVTTFVFSAEEGR